MELVQGAKPKGRKSYLVVGGVLLLAGLALIAWWFYFWAPMRRVMDNDWKAQHSELAAWEEEMQWWNRTGSVPSSALGFHRAVLWGKRPEFERILGYAPGFTGCRDCSGIDLGLNSISNHTFKTDEEWNAWYRSHHEQTQEQWIQEGFANAGVTVSMPPAKDETEPLLLLLGRRDKPALDRRGIMVRKHSSPSWLNFNAYRWLLDSGFDPVAYLLEHPANALSEDIVEGIKHFQEHKLWYPQPGEKLRLSFVKPVEDVWDMGFPHKAPSYTNVTAQWIVYGIMLGLCWSGVRLMRKGLLALPVKSAPASPTSHPPSTGDGPIDH